MKKRKKITKNINKKIKTNKKADSKFYNNSLTIVVRYLILLALMFSLPLIYKIFTPLTIYPLAALFKLVYSEVVLYKDLIVLNSKIFIKIIPACVAGSAYLLFLILNLSVPMNLKKRIYTIFLSFLLLLVFNILRIFIFSIIYSADTSIFYLTHEIFWYFVSTIFVVAIWFLIVKIFSIKEIPIYTDLKFFLIKSKIFKTSKF
jgi:exosortase/archaeosortase family protein